MAMHFCDLFQKDSFRNHCKYSFGDYVQTHEPHDNSMASRTIGALALRPTGNIQGNFYFCSLSTGRVINRHAATALPMSAKVIGRVHRQARRQKAHPVLVFLNCQRQPFDDDGPDDDDESDDDNDAHVPHDSDDDDDDEDYVTYDSDGEDGG